MAITPRQMLVPSSKYSIKCPYSMTPEYITVHNTANDASANNEISYMINNDKNTSYHFAVDDKEVVQGLPLNRNGFHAGDGANGTGNRKTIGIEICYSKSGGDRFIKAEKLAAKFIAQLLDERKWSVAKMKKHQDWSGKYCPHRTLDMGWQRFVTMVQAELDALHKPTYTWKDMDKVAYTIIRDTPLVDLSTGKTVKTMKKGETFEAVQVCTKDGAEYVRTDYSKSKGIDNAVKLADLEAPKKPEPKPEPEPAPVAPSPEDETKEDTDHSQEDVSDKNKNEGQQSQTGGDTAKVNWLYVIVKTILDFIKSIFTKKTK